MKDKICNKAGKIADAVKRKGDKALYKITQVTGMRKKLDAIKNKVDRAIERVENLEKAVGECQGQQERSSQTETPLLDCAELFEQYQREHEAEQTIQAAGQTVMKEVEKSR